LTTANSNLGAWEQRKFSNLVKKVGKHPSVPGDYTAYSVSNVDGLIPQTQQFDGSRLDVLDKSAYKVVNPGEFAYNPARINVGSIAYNDLEFPVLVSSLYVVVRMDQAIDDEFILQFIRSPQFLKEVRRNTEGSVREYLFFDNFKNVRFPFALNIEEQQKVGSFLRTMDDTIALHQRKLAKLKELKQSYLQKLFPKNGSKFPQLRFAGFADAWEERKLGGITEYIKGFAFKSKDYKKSGYRIIRVSDLGKESIKNSNDSIFTSEEIAIQQKKYKIKQDEIIITTVGSKAEMKESAVGRPIIISESLGYLLNQNLVKIYGKENYSNYFIYSQLLQPRYSDYISMIQRGNANQANIAINDLWEFQILIPEIEEQQKIGSFFKQLDDTIALHQRRLNALRRLKEGLLQKLFV
jgi:type I restriction enzyme S subunit